MLMKTISVLRVVTAVLLFTGFASCSGAQTIRMPTPRRSASLTAPVWLPPTPGSLEAVEGAVVGVGPTTPSSLTVTSASQTQINLSWTASAEVSGTIAGYQIERCQGARCNFAPVGTSAI